LLGELMLPELTVEVLETYKRVRMGTRVPMPTDPKGRETKYR